MAASNNGETPEIFESDDGGRAVAAARPGTDAGMATGPGVSIDERVDLLRTTGMGFRHLRITAAYLVRLWPARWTPKSVRRTTTRDPDSA
jgi:hypothetical protein